MQWSTRAALFAAAIWMTGCGAQPVALPVDTGETRQLLSHREGDRLGLTADQKTKLAAMKAKFKASIDTSQLAKLADMICAEKLDKGALQPALTALVGLVDKAMGAKLDFMGDFREMLTEEQRQKLADRKHKGSGRCGCEHKRAFLEGMLGHSPRDLWTAMRAFMKSGDEAALQAAFKTDKTVEQRVAAMLAALEAMSAEERAKIGRRMQKMAD